MYWSPNIEKTKQEETIETIIFLVSSLFSIFGGLSTALNGFSLFSKLLPGISRQQTIFMSDLRFFVQWFDCSIVQSFCDCSTVQSAVCLSKCLAAAPVFLLGATRHFVLLSCKICAEIVVYRMLAVFINGLNGKNSSRSIVRNICSIYIFIQVSRLVIASILLSHRLLSRESGL